MVYSFVEERGGLALLKDKRVVAATADVSGISMNKAEVWIASAVTLVRRVGGHGVPVAIFAWPRMAGSFPSK